MKKIANFIVEKRRIVLIFFLILTICSAWLTTKVSLNDDMTKYLPDDSSMKQGLEIMEAEFDDAEDTSTLKLMFVGLNSDEKQQIYTSLSELEGVETIDYEAGNPDYEKDENTLYSITAAMAADFDAASDLLEKIDEKYSEYEFYTGGEVVDANKALLTPALLITAVTVLCIILFVMSASWIEPLLYLATIAIAIVINMGTNAFLKSVSSVTYSISAILQLCLSMDYSIILSNRYRQEKMISGNKVEAMKKALKNAASSIVSSSFTTIVGLLMLVFMSFKIGQDMGIVLAKGVFLSLICIFTILPGLLIMSDKLIEKTKKREFHTNLRGIGKVAYKLLYVIPVAFLLIFAGSITLRDKVDVSMAFPNENVIENYFPSDTTTVVLYDNSDEQNIAVLAEELEQNENVTSASCYSNTLNKPFTAEELSDALEEMGSDMALDPSLLNIIFYDMFGNGEVGTMTLNQFAHFIDNELTSNEYFADELDEDMLAQIDQLSTFTDPDEIQKPLTSAELAELLEMDQEELEQLYMYYFGKNPTDEDTAMTIQTFVDFIQTDVANDEQFASFMDADALAQINALSTYTDPASINAHYTSSQMAYLFGMDSDMAEQIYFMYYSTYGATSDWLMTLPDFVACLQMIASSDPTYASYFDAETLAQIDMLAIYTDPEVIQAQYTSSELALLTGMDENMVGQIYSLYYASSTAQTMTLREFVNFLASDVITNEAYATYFDDTQKAQIASMQALLNAAVSGTAYTGSELASFTGLDTLQAEQLLAGAGVTKMTLPDFVDYLLNTASASLDEAALAQLTSMKAMIDVAVSGNELNASQLAEIMSIDQTMVEQLLVLSSDDMPATEAMTMSLKDFFDFTVNNVASNEQYAAQFDAAAMEQMKTMQALMNISLSGTQMSSAELASYMGMDASMASQVFYMYYSEQGETSGWTMTPKWFVDFLLSNVASNPQYASSFGSSAISEMRTLQNLMNAALSGNELTSAQLSALVGMDSETTNLLYAFYTLQYGNTSGWLMSMDEFVDFVVSDVAEDEVFSSNFSDDALDELTSLQKILNSVSEGGSYAAADMAELMGGFSDQMDAGTIELVYLYYFSEADFDPSWALTLQQFVGYVSNEMVNDERFAAYFDDETKSALDDAEQQLKDGTEQLQGSNYSRLILTTTLPTESEQTTAFFDELSAELDSGLDGEYYLIGDSAMAYEMDASFSSEINFITLLSIIAIFVVVALAFRNLLIPFILVCIIQCAVFITMSTVYFQGNSLFYLALLIVQCLLIGATIDYGILYTSYYREMRCTMDVKQAVLAAFERSSHTILTSSLILISITAVVGFTTADPMTGLVCLTISQGALFATLLIIFVLPSCLSSFDRFIVRRTSVNECNAISEQAPLDET